MKTNDKLERIRKRYALFTRFPKPVDSRGSVSRWYYAPDCKVVQYRPRPTTPDAATHPGESAESASHSQLCAGSPADGRPIDNSGSGNDTRIVEPLTQSSPFEKLRTQYADALRKAFRFSKCNPLLAIGDYVMVRQWGHGKIVAFFRERAIVSNGHMTASFTLSRCQLSSADIGMNWTDFYQWQKDHGKIGKSTPWHQKGQFYSDMPPFRFADVKGL